MVFFIMQIPACKFYFLHEFSAQYNSSNLVETNGYLGSLNGREYFRRYGDKELDPSFSVSTLKANVPSVNIEVSIREISLHEAVMQLRSPFIYSETQTIEERSNVGPVNKDYTTRTGNICS
jgi:hypothetical protein